LKIRNTSFFTYLASTDWFAKFLYVTDLRQDVFISEEMVCDALELDRDACSECNLCRDVCPLELELPKELEHTDFCINCMYCYSVCPENAIKFKGRLGFFQEQIKQYDRQIRRIYR
jgi:ferredoxin